MMKKLVSLIIFIPIAIVLIVLSVANRHPVVFNLDPINPDQPFLAITLPFFVFLFAALLIGLLLGGMATWFTQGKHRKLARETKREATKWQHEAQEQKTRAEQVIGQISDNVSSPNPASKALGLPDRVA
ncbi:MAG: lipopolysaccharide assembly protein LapA domain-containing protein [Rhizobiaceae bacterium]|nr:lipopolysaccharide assembly protein LapA domain-containing protein [Rhizobiaceae bacterium]